MKKFVCLTLCVCLMSIVACGEKPGYVITGTAEGTEDGDSVYLCNMQGFFEMVPTDTAIVKNGKFEFKGNYDGASLRFIIATHKGQSVGNWAQVILERKANIDVQIFSKDSRKETIVNSDGPESKLYADYTALQDKWNKIQQPSWDIVREQKGTPDEIAAAQKEMDSITVEMHKAEKQFMIDNMPSGVSDMVLEVIYSRADDKEKNELLALFKEKSPNTPHYKKIVADIEASKRSEVGSKYTDFEMDDPDGKKLTISQFVNNNKYTLIDFWASWCGPCCAEMPNVVEAYKKYHDKGLEIVGVSFDNNKDAWLSGLKRLNMTWPQVSDLKGWDCAASGLYNIKAIPANILIDSKGVIVAKNLRDKALQTKLAELLP